jgi:hypothetical protein
MGKHAKKNTVEWSREKRPPASLAWFVDNGHIVPYQLQVSRNHKYNVFVPIVLNVLTP